MGPRGGRGGLRKKPKTVRIAGFLSSYKAVPGVRGRFLGPRLPGREAKSVDTSC